VHEIFFDKKSKVVKQFDHTQPTHTTNTLFAVREYQ